MSKEKGKPFYFQVVKSKELMGASIRELDMSQRAQNSLVRIGIEMVGDLVAVLEGVQRERLVVNLSRNLGEKSAHEIMLALYEFNLECLGKQKMVEYLKETFDRQADPTFRPDISDEEAKENCARIRKEAAERIEKTKVAKKRHNVD